MNMDTFIKTILPVLIASLIGMGTCSIKISSVESASQNRLNKLSSNLIFEISKSKECK